MSNEKKEFTEADIPNAMLKFAISCTEQFRTFGLQAEDPAGSFKLCFSDNPIMKREDLHSCHGRFKLHGPEWAKAYWPYADLPGIYLFFTTEEKACYVGKSERAIGYRASAHMGPLGPEAAYPLREFKSAEYMIAIPFEKAPFLAPAFESFLLHEYNFPENKSLASHAMGEQLGY